MRIKHVEIGNLRKQKTVHIDFASETTIFVSANNSGKTSATVALRRFLVDRSGFSINDFTLSHWPKIDAGANPIGQGQQAEALSSGRSASRGRSV